MRLPATLVVPFWMLLAALGCSVHAQSPESLAPPAPFALKPAPAAPAAELILQLDARRALEIGLPSIASAIYQRLLENPAIAGGARNQIALDLSTALLQEDRVAEAARALQSIVGLPTPAIRLRQGLIAARERRFEVARAEAAALSPDELPAEDRPWLFFLRGLIAEEGGGAAVAQASAFYQQAVDAAVSSAQRAWFVLARERTKLTAGVATENAIEQYRQLLERNAGRPAGFSAVRQLAVAYNDLGRRADAVTLLQAQLQILPRQERQTHDEWQLLLGLIAGASDGVGRIALRTLLTSPSDADKQRIALRLLADASKAPGRRDEFRGLLNELINATPAHPILEDLLLFRAQLALADKKDDRRYVQAEADANRLLAEYPGSQLKAAALGVLTAADWEQGRYRNAANQASRARAELPPGSETRARLGVLVAEAYFRGRDYRNSADAYISALAEIPAGIFPGALMFQRVQAEVEAGRLDEAEAALDELARDARFDLISRWQAEWNLARALQAADKTERAYARVNRLLEAANGSVAGLPAELRAQLAWLRAQLSFEAGEFTRTVAFAGELLSRLEEVEPALKTSLASTALLLQARASFRAGLPTEDLLRRLRSDYPRSDAAIYSYILEANEAAAKGLFSDAQASLKKLAEDFKESSYAPFALYLAAIYAKSRAPDPQYYSEANTILEGLVTTYPQSELFFYARLQQGELLKLLGDYGRARIVYEDLVTRFRFPQFPDALAAELALADCYAAMAAADPALAGSAAEIYGRLMDQQLAPVDMRIEAGHKFGLGFINRNDPARAIQLWWPLVNGFLLDEGRAAKLGAKGRYWMARTLLVLSSALEREGKLDEARAALDMIGTYRLRSTSRP